jgi:CubicO group peptidase (beta-lactamase class C family)
MQAVPDTAVDPSLAPLDLGRVEALVDAFAAEGGQPGLAYGVVRHGQLVHAGGRGVAAVPVGPTPGPDTVFRIASMTKSFTAAAVLLLRDEGALALDDEAVRYVPELAGVRLPTADAPPITLRTLLTMAAGFPTDDPWGDRQQGLPGDDFAGLLAGGLSFAWSPGVAFEYSNLSYAVLGRVVTAAAGRPYADVVRERLLAPLGMTSTVFEADDAPAGSLAAGHRRSGLTRHGWETVPYDPYGAFAPMGGLFSTVRDLARWVGEYLDAFPPRDDPESAHPLRRSSRREQQQPHRAYPGRTVWPSFDEPPVLRSAAYGFGLVAETHPAFGTIVGHSGGYPGFGSHMRWHPDTGLGVVVLGNSTYAPASVLAERLLDALLRGQEQPVRVTPWPATEAAAADVEKLLESWDDALADRLLAMNVSLDEPLAARRARFERARQLLGPLSPDPAAPVERATPAHRAWWLRGPHGRLRVEIRMTPELPPRVQTLNLQVVPDPSAHLRHALAQLAWSLNSPLPRVPELLAFTAQVDRAALERSLRLAQAWSGGVGDAEVVGGDGVHEASVRFRGVRRDVVVTVRLTVGGPYTGNGVPRVTAVTVRPATT